MQYRRFAATVRPPPDPPLPPSRTSWPKAASAANGRKRRRVIFVVASGYLPRTITGANVSLHALCRRLIGAGLEPLVVCTPDPAGMPGESEWSAAYPIL